MNKDQSLKLNENKLVLLLVGNDNVGKKTISRQWMHKYSSTTSGQEENRTFYKIFNFVYEDSLEDMTRVSIPVELRVINGDELETDLKVNASYFKGALGAFVVSDIDEFMTFQDGIKWKDKVDIMCCLPNKFPLPIYLLINQCDKLERVKRSPWMEKFELDKYIRENQFFNSFFISAKETPRDINRESSLSNNSVEVEFPLRDMIRTIFQFKDIRDKLLNPKNGSRGKEPGTPQTILKNPARTTGNDSSTISSNSDSFFNNKEKDRGDGTNRKCIIF